MSDTNYRIMKQVLSEQPICRDPFGAAFATLPLEGKREVIEAMLKCAALEELDDTAGCLEDLIHDLDGIAEQVRRQDRRGVFDTINRAERALDGDWSWRIK
jgi:hypothetical protein